MVKSRSYSPLRYAPWCFRDQMAEGSSSGKYDFGENQFIVS